MAHRLARLVYRMLKYGQEYIDKGTEYYEERTANNKSNLLRKKGRQTWTSSRRAPSLKESFWRGMSRKSSASTGGREDFGLEIQPTVCKCAPSIRSGGLALAGLPFRRFHLLVVTTPIES